MSRPIAANSAVTTERAQRLAKLLRLMAAKTTKTREALLGKLRVDLRSFYRDVKLLRERGIAMSTERDTYILEDDLDEATGKLPCPDLGLSVADLKSLAGGKTEAHKKIRRLLAEMLGEQVNGKK